MHKVTHQETIIKLTNVTFWYSSEDSVIKDVSCEIHKGDYVGVVGPNGSGKSTLVKLMLGLLKPQTGTVELFGENISDFKSWYKIGYVPQKNYVEMNFPVTAGEVVAMGTYGKRGLLHFPKKEDARKVDVALDRVGMSGFKNRRIGDLSGGQQQRIFIARALVSDPEVIFLDEPTVGVDVKTQKEFYALLRKLNREFDLTLVLVTHELDVVAHEATELGYINRTMEYWGEPEAFLKGEYFHELIGQKGLHH